MELTILARSSPQDAFRRFLALCRQAPEAAAAGTDCGRSWLGAQMLQQLALQNIQGWSSSANAWNVAAEVLFCLGSDCLPWL
eukprot:s899_g18.t1